MSRGWLHSDLEKLRGEILQKATWMAAGFAVFLLWATAFTYRPTVSVQSLGYDLARVSAIVAVAWLAARYRITSVTIGSVMLLGGMTVVLTATFFTEGNSHLAYWYALLVILAGSLLGTRGVVAQGAIACVVIAVAAGRPPLLAVPEAALAILFTIVAALISWLSLRTLYTALEWAWQSYLQALHNTELLRDRQMQLRRALDLLQQTNRQLAQTNESLARAREVAEEARRLKAEFVANVSHELRTPLNHIIGFADTMLNAPETYETPLPTGYADDMAAIYRSARHLSRLVDDVLDLSQVEVGRMALVKEKVSLAEVISEAITIVAGLYRAKALLLERVLAPGLPLVYADRTRIRQVIINLLNNAARFTERGKVVIAAWADGAGVRCSVNDTGIGIAAEHLPKVFEAFYQIDSSTARRHEGSGLGLAICKQFVERHGGTIEAASELGRGSTFTLPLTGTNGGSTLTTGAVGSPLDVGTAHRPRPSPA